MPNPFHVPAGSSKGGQFTSKQLGTVEYIARESAGLPMKSNMTDKLFGRIKELAEILKEKMKTNRQIESGYVLTSEGEHVSGYQRGSKNSEIRLNASKGQVTIHTHPSGNSFSMMDVISSAEAEVGFAVVVTNDAIYVLEPGVNGWGNVISQVNAYDPHSVTSEFARKHGLIYTKR